MRYAQIRKMDISDRPRIRVELYTQGCPIHCEGCHNQSTWDFNGGKEFNQEHMKLILDLCNKDYIVGLSILGGEPLISSNFQDLASLVKQFKIRYPNKTIWLWTGFDFINLLKTYRENNWFHTIIENLDVVVDGKFKEDLKDPHLKYRGSSNQRVIDVKETFKKHKVVLYKEGE